MSSQAVPVRPFALPAGRPSILPISWRDVWLSVAAVSTGVIMLFEQRSAPPPRPDLTRIDVPMAIGLVAAFVPLIALIWRPRLRGWLLALAVAGSVVANIARVPNAVDLASIATVYTFGALGSWRWVAISSGVLVAWSVPAEMLLQRRVIGPLEALGSVAVVLVASAVIGMLGLYMATRRVYVETLVQRTSDLERETELLERERELLARQAVAAERARIARELHDVVAHHVSVMVIQAGAAEASLPPNATASQQALEAVRETGREALTEMRRLLGLLRSDASVVATDESGERAPQPGLADLPALADRTRDAGVDVTIVTEGEPRRVPLGIDLSVYRVVQEALTNTLRHSGAEPRAAVRLRYEPEALLVEVRDDGGVPGRAGRAVVASGSGQPGHGLLGMRERVGLFGGTFEAGPMPAGGFHVLARFPIEPARTAEPSAVPAAEGSGR